MRVTFLAVLVSVVASVATSWSKPTKKRRASLVSSQIVIAPMNLHEQTCRLMKSPYLANRHSVHCLAGSQWLLDNQKTVYSLGESTWIVTEPTPEIGKGGVRAWYVSTTESHASTPLRCWKNQNTWDLAREGFVEALEIQEGPLKLRCQSGYLERFSPNPETTPVSQASLPWSAETHP